RTKAMAFIGVSFGITFAIAMVLGPIVTHSLGLNALFWMIAALVTPLYITLIYDVMSQRRLRWGYAFSALLAVIGAGVIRYDRVT
ncbi:hypothetical protein MJL33_31960, partial [Salmonella enterica subsp. enterica serovar Kentucky]|nr:hypothetical protein [Salmonella enterica subsp. enterica serovar Kentucky]